MPKYTTDQLKEVVKTSETYIEVFRKLGYKSRSMDRVTKRGLLQNIKDNNIDAGHLKHYSDSIEFNHSKFKLEDLLVENGTYKGGSANLKARLFRAKLLKEECSICKLPNIWQGRPITLQMDHINGIFNDNRLENLRILCPNCHSQTDTYAGKNSKVKASPRPICICGNTMKKGSKICKTCQDKNQETVKWPPDEELFELVRTLGVKKAAVRCGCWSHNLIHRLTKKNFDYSPYYKPGRQSDLL